MHQDDPVPDAAESSSTAAKSSQAPNPSNMPGTRSLSKDRQHTHSSDATIPTSDHDRSNKGTSRSRSMPSSRPSALDSTPSLSTGPNGHRSMSDILGTFSKALSEKENAYEREIQRLKAQLMKNQDLVMKYHTNALNWCTVAKTYQQDRNMVAFRLSELERQISERVKESERAAKSTSKADAPTAPQDIHAVGDSISQILDDMKPPESTKEPILPTFRTSSNVFKDESGKGLRSALKSTHTHECTCSHGCKEEIRTWQARCSFAENQATIWEMRHENVKAVMDAYKSKWTHWKEGIIRNQYRRRSMVALAAHANPTLAGQSPQHQHSPKKRARFGTEETDSSQQRQDVTLKNTLFNQHGLDLHPTDLANHSSPGKGSATEPLLLSEDDKDDFSAGRTPRLQRHAKSSEDAFTLDSDDSLEEYEPQPLSLTFPSDLALLNRQYPSEPEDDDDSSDPQVLASIGAPTGRRSRTTSFQSKSPTTRASETRSLRRPLAYPTRPTSSTIPPLPPPTQFSAPPRTHLDSTPQKPTKRDHHSNHHITSFESEMSSPPMFESLNEAFHVHDLTNGDHGMEAQSDGTLHTPKKATTTTTEGRAKTAPTDPISPSSARTQTPVTTIMALPSHTPRVTPKSNRSPHQDLAVSSRPKITPEQHRVFVPETPLELQGLTPVKDGQVHTTTSDESNSASDHGGGQVKSKSPLTAASSKAHDSHGSIQQPSQKETMREKESSSARGGMAGHSRGVGSGGEEKSGLSTSRLSRHPSRDEGGLSHVENRPRGPPAEEERIYNFTERNKDKRKQMHGQDCACCSRFYDITGPVPIVGQDPFFTPAPRPGEKEVWEQTTDERRQQRIQAISRHRVHHETPLTPPGFWDTDFPLTPERLEWDRIADERRERKKQRQIYEQNKKKAGSGHR